MKWIGQQIYDQISRFRNDVYLESISSGTIASGGNLGLDSNNKIVKAAASSGGISYDGSTANGVLTFKDADEATVEANLTFDGSTLAVTGNLSISGDITSVGDDINVGDDIVHTSAGGKIRFEGTAGGGSEGLLYKDSGGTNRNALFFPGSDVVAIANRASNGIVEIRANTSSAGSGGEVTAATFTDTELTLSGNLDLKDTTNDANGSILSFTKDKGAAAADGDDIGTIMFQGDNAAQELSRYASIVAEISEADDTDEAGKLTLNVAESDGSTAALSPGLILEGEHATDGQVDVTIANGSASTTTVAGDLSITTGLILDSVDVTTIQTSSESFADNDTSLMTSAAIDDAILKGGSSTIIKILPNDFLSNEDGGVNKSEQYDDNNFGVRTTHHNAELFAFVDIPIGKTATSVIIYGSDTGNAVDVFEADINAGALTDKTPGGGCVVGSACDITDVVADATNYLVIRVTTTHYVNDIVYGGAVTIA